MRQFRKYVASRAAGYDRVHVLVLAWNLAPPTIGNTVAKYLSEIRLWHAITLSYPGAGLVVCTVLRYGLTYQNGGGTLDLLIMKVDHQVRASPIHAEYYRGTPPWQRMVGEGDVARQGIRGSGYAAMKMR
jgi:hypothetical protein